MTEAQGDVTFFPSEGDSAAAAAVDAVGAASAGRQAGYPFEFIHRLTSSVLIR